MRCQRRFYFGIFLDRPSILLAKKYLPRKSRTEVTNLTFVDSEFPQGLDQEFVLVFSYCRETGVCGAFKVFGCCQSDVDAALLTKEERKPHVIEEFKPRVIQERSQKAIQDELQL